MKRTTGTTAGRWGRCPQTPGIYRLRAKMAEGNRHRGSGHPLSPATPPDMRVRIRRFSSVELEYVQQPRKTEHIEVSNRKRRRQGRTVGDAPWSMGTTGGLGREVMSDVSLA